jgi:Ca2+-binding RTX toxin-like protein
MGVALLLLGLVPLYFLGDMILGAGSDPEGEADEGGGDAPRRVALDTVLRPEDGDETPVIGDPVDPDTVLAPNEGDETPVIGAPVDPAKVLDPVDTPGEGYVPGSGSALQGLLATQTDFNTGVDWLGDHAPSTADHLLGAGDDALVLPDGGAGAGAVSDHDGTPVIGAMDSVDLVDGGAGNDEIALGERAAYAFGGSGADTMRTGSGASALFGGTGQDVLIGGVAASVMDGGPGDDRIHGGPAGERLFGGAHAADGTTIADDDVIDGGPGDDFVAGGFGADRLFGGGGDDVIDHHGRVEQQIGWERHAFDWYIDGAADDLHGGAGRDTLIMDRADRATGGAGVDTFWVYHDDATGAGHAEVMDFEPGVDFLRVTLNPVLDHGEIEVAVGASADGADGVVSVNGTVVALLRGTPDITPSDVLVEVTPDIFS